MTVSFASKLACSTSVSRAILVIDQSLTHPQAQPRNYIEKILTVSLLVFSDLGQQAIMIQKIPLAEFVACQKQYIGVALIIKCLDYFFSILREKTTNLRYTKCKLGASYISDLPQRVQNTIACTPSPSAIVLVANDDLNNRHG